MIFNMTGGMPLNFRVISGTAQPASPKDKDIWVETAAQISGWVFSAVEPESPCEGMVWILTGSRGAVRFDALKKNSIELYPLRARQYLSGAWEDVTARSYIGGAWTKWLEDMALFDGGEVFEAVTGGWTGINGGGPDTDSLYIGNDGFAAGQVWTEKAVDVSGYSVLKLTIRYANDTAKAGLMADLPRSDNWGSANEGNVLALTSSADSTLVCDISGLEGSYFIWISRATSGGNAGERSVTVAKVELIAQNSSQATGNEVALLMLMDDTDTPVQTEIDGQSYGVENMTVNEGPTANTYDFTVL